MIYSMWIPCGIQQTKSPLVAAGYLAGLKSGSNSRASWKARIHLQLAANNMMLDLWGSVSYTVWAFDFKKPKATTLAADEAIGGCT